MLLIHVVNRYIGVDSLKMCNILINTALAKLSSDKAPIIFIPLHWIKVFIFRITAD